VFTGHGRFVTADRDDGAVLLGKTNPPPPLRRRIITSLQYSVCATLLPSARAKAHILILRVVYCNTTARAILRVVRREPRGTWKLFTGARAKDHYVFYTVGGTVISLCAFDYGARSAVIARCAATLKTARTRT